MIKSPNHQMIKWSNHDLIKPWSGSWTWQVTSWGPSTRRWQSRCPWLFLNFKFCHFNFLCGFFFRWWSLWPALRYFSWTQTSLRISMVIYLFMIELNVEMKNCRNIGMVINRPLLNVERRDFWCEADLNWMYLARWYQW